MQDATDGEECPLAQSVGPVDCALELLDRIDLDRDPRHVMISNNLGIRFRALSFPCYWKKCDFDTVGWARPGSRLRSSHSRVRHAIELKSSACDQQSEAQATEDRSSPSVRGRAYEGGRRGVGTTWYRQSRRQASAQGPTH
jgi:hypothetical protein